MRNVLLAALCFAAPLHAADDKPAVRTLDLNGVRVVAEKDAGRPAPVEVKDAEALAVSPLFPDAASRDAIKKQVNFATEKLVVFAWSGSGGDVLTPELKVTDTKAVTAFTYTHGRTRDIRRHALVFAVPKDAIVEVQK